jgi:hypothetical protein
VPVSHSGEGSGAPAGGNLNYSNTTTTPPAVSNVNSSVQWNNSQSGSQKGLFNSIQIGKSALTSDGSGNLLINGSSVVSSTAFGSMYAYNVTQSVTVSATDTYYEVPGSMTAGTISNTDFTFQNSSELLCNTAGKYLANWSMAVTCATTSQEVEGGVLLNGTIQQNTACHCEVATGDANRPDCVAGSGIITLNVNDVVSFGVLEHTAIHNIVVQHATMTLTRISN